MLKRELRKLFFLPLMVFGMAVSGCVSVLPEPQTPTALVRLPTSGFQGADTPLNSNVVIHIPDAMGAIAGAEIASSEDQRIRYIKDVKWADSPARLLQAAVVEALTASEGDGLAVPVQVGARGDYDLKLSLLDLTVDNVSEEAVCKVRLVLTRSGDKKIISSNVVQAVELINEKKSVSRAEALARAIKGAAENAANIVAQNSKPYDLIAERNAARAAKRAERQKLREKEQLDADPETLENPAEELVEELTPEI